MSYEVVVEELRDAAKKYRTVSSPYACYHLPVTNISEDSIGHADLAGWVAAAAEECDTEAKAIGDGGESLAATLEAQATNYELTDAGIGGIFTQGTGQLPGSPFGFPGTGVTP